MSFMLDIILEGQIMSAMSRRVFYKIAVYSLRLHQIVLLIHTD